MSSEATIDNYTRERWQLLQSLRSTVESLLTNGVSNVWNVYGGLNRLHNVMEKIFKHGCRIFDTKGEPDFWTFIQGLNWLQPSLATSPTIRDCDDYHANLCSRIVSHKDILWLYKSLEDHSLSQKLSWLLSDKEHLLSCLEPWAFLCQENLAEATLVCLRAVEKNQPTLLTEIDPSLFLPSWNSKDSPKRAHRRSSSYPVNLCSSAHPVVVVDEIPPSRSAHDFSAEHKDAVALIKNELVARAIKEETSSNASIKAWSSFPHLNENGSDVVAVGNGVPEKGLGAKEPRVAQSIELSDVIKVDYTETTSIGASTFTEVKTSPVKPKFLSRKGRKTRLAKLKKSQRNSGSSDTLNYEESPKPSTNSNAHLTKSLGSGHSVTDSIKIEMIKPKWKSSFLGGSAPEFSGPWSTEVEGQKDVRTPKKSFIEDGGSSVLPMATGYFPQPKEGQSLTSFLSSAQFARANAELDRENAHFSISEAMIAAIEQVKCNKQLRLADEAAEESDEEINSLKQRIRLRRRQRQEERRKGSAVAASTWNRDLLSDGKTDTTTTDQSVSPMSTSSGLLVSMASLYSEADLYRSSSKQATESNMSDNTVSAEGVALSLISRFSEKHLPRASELQWLVSEQDAPQCLLPLPQSWPISPDDAEGIDGNSIHLRGTVEWAPPRPQIIFTAHPPPVRRILIAKQNYRCAGCGMKVAVEYASRFRYCEYLGRYFCTGCHTNQVSLIPGRILSKWDFNRYPVSNFSYRLLDQMTVDPLFQVSDLNPTLYRRIKQLDRTRLLRTQLFYLKDFLLTCRFATIIQQELKKEPSHIITEPHIYSIQNFVQVKTGILPTELNKLVQESCNHVANCVLCQARGFICELCNSKDVIYPWEMNKVTRCDNCGTCYHIACANPDSNTKKIVDCKRCSRLRARHESKEDSSSEIR
ncbi:run domain Beclin-1-interacting and cysteine-rich domain-containing protein isoform X2 [Phymastichus coffea]|uniref:run domain Beclin-1-interacting and cysteine-rich domain-containing protein isoform X2 n=1 Tax=Phymastichus coffea TaxID=108790 RepID=UPI00273CD95D|nr:run domain Beclin-1-interacting and cysteine-rich domain-containing protein isoform X2 [Phymastichus coffea]